MSSGPITSWQIVGKTMETVTDFHFAGSKITPDGDCSVQFSCSVMSDSLQPHESQHARPPCPSPTPGVHSDSHGKTISLTRRTFVGKVMSQLLNMLSRLVITFLPKSKRLLISWLQSPSAVILEPPKVKSAIVSIVSPSIYHEVMGPDAMIFVF